MKGFRPAAQLVIAPEPKRQTMWLIFVTLNRALGVGVVTRIHVDD